MTGEHSPSAALAGALPHKPAFAATGGSAPTVAEVEQLGLFFDTLKEFLSHQHDVDHAPSTLDATAEAAADVAAGAAADTAVHAVSSAMELPEAATDVLQSAANTTVDTGGVLTFLALGAMLVTRFRNKKAQERHAARKAEKEKIRDATGAAIEVQKEWNDRAERAVKTKKASLRTRARIKFRQLKIATAGVVHGAGNLVKSKGLLISAGAASVYAAAEAPGVAGAVGGLTVLGGWLTQVGLPAAMAGAVVANVAGAAVFVASAVLIDRAVRFATGGDGVFQPLLDGAVCALIANNREDRRTALRRMQMRYKNIGGHMMVRAHRTVRTAKKFIKRLHQRGGSKQKRPRRVAQVTALPAPAAL